MLQIHAACVYVRTCVIMHVCEQNACDQSRRTTISLGLVDTSAGLIEKTSLVKQLETV